MECHIIDAAASAAWDEYVQSSPDVVNWHQYDWYKVAERYSGVKYYPIALYEASRITGILPIYHVKSFRTGSVLVSIPFVAVGGVVADTQEGRQKLFERAVALSDELGSIPITLKQYAHRIEGDFITDDGFYNRELNLFDDLDTIWNGLDEINRDKVEASRELPLALEYPSDNLREFARLLLNYQRRRGKPSSASLRWVEMLVSTGMYSTALLKLNGETVAAAMVKKFKDMVSFPWSCLSKHPQADDLAYRMFWDLIVHCKEDGLRIFHSGRTPLTNEAPTYRRGWGGDTGRYYYQYYGLKTSGESAHMTSRSRRTFETLWKLCPDRIAGLLGPAIVRQFP